MKSNIKSPKGILLLLFFTLMIASTNAQSVKVFILAGQSNMQGQGDILPADVTGTLTQYMSTDPEEFWYIQDDDGEWIERDDVWVRYKQEDGSVLAENLNVGLGATSNQIGPELSFGHIISEESDSRVLIVKTAWGGKSLAVDFRPPSSGGATGFYYDQMISDVREAIDNLELDFDNFERGGNVEIAGFCWFQGWNDGDEQAFAEEYEVNLNNLISDVRVDLNVLDLPFVVALTGNGGYELEPEGTWVGNLQHQVLPAQINAIENGGHENVAYVDTREFWPDPDASPEEDFGFHWYNNAESFLRIGAGLGQAMFDLLGGEDQDDEEPENQDTSFCSCGNCGLESNTSSNATPYHGIPCLGSVQPNTNMALPSSYGFQEYVFPEPDDQVPCRGIDNTTATIEQVYLAQTHRQPIGHPLQFTIGERPALLQIAITGTGAAPDVQVEGILNGNSLGTMCLDGPATLSSSIDLAAANFDDYFSVTLPKAWITIGLELRLRAGNAERILTQEDLKISPYTELNLVEFDMDIMDYNQEPHRTPVYDNFLQELASAIPASVIRFGKFPDKLRMADFALNNADGNTVVVNSNDMAYENGLNTGNLNFAANYMVDIARHALGDSPNTIYYGNTLNLDPGGWGGGGTFVGFEYNDVFIHELGHALSLPHWVEDYRRTNPHPEQYSYPFAGEEGEGSGRGDTWNFIQATYEFVSPRCEDESGILGTERSDAMLRGYYCAERRTSGRGPWDGFGVFSALAMNRNLLGSVNEWGQIEDRGELLDFHLRQNDGYPIASLQNEKRVFSRHPSQPQNTYAEEYIKLPGEEQIEQEAYLITGSAHATTQAANIIYEPLKYKGTILPIIDPTDSEMFSTLQDVRFEDAPEFFGRTRDITLKLTYIDGTVKHVLVPFASFDRPDQFPDENLQPKYFAVSVPADKLLCNVEMYHRDFIIYDETSDERGNINDAAQNITAANFMNEAVLMASLDHSCNCPGTPNYIAPGTPCDDGNPYTINDVEDGYCNCEGTQIASCGEITNSAFTESLAGWRYWGIEAESINEEATITISDVDDAGFGFEPIEVSLGETYTLKFEAYAEENRPLTVIHKAEYDYENDQEGEDFLNTTFDLTTTKTEYEITYTAIENDQLSFLEFNFSGNEAGLFIDNVCFDLGCSPVEIPYNGIDDDCDTATLDDDLDQDGFDLVDDCNDNDPNINPNQTEVSNNGIDDDCNEETLDDDIIDVEIASCGLINNGQFDENLDSWWTWGGDVTIIDGEAVFEDIDLDDSGIAQGPLEFSSSTHYNLTFSAYASETRYIEVVIYLDEEPYTEYNRVSFVLSSLRQDYKMSFTFDGSSITNGAIAFEMRNDSSSVFLDNVCLDVVVCEETEIAYNGIDDDCNPATLDDDLDQDGFPLVFDCDDTDSNINPDQAETPYNGIDDDCNTTTLDDDLDQDGYALADDCNDDDPNINPGQLEEPDNGVDEDCDASNDTTEEDSEEENSNEDDEEEENNEEDNEDDDSTSEIAIGGRIQPNTNPALPSSYNFMEYVFPEPDDQGECMGIENTTATISDIFLSQTHRHAIGHPLLFTIGERPALLQIAVTGTGAAPDVQVEGVMDGVSLGTLCLNGPSILSPSIDLDRPNFSDYFSVTLPKAWIKIGLELKVSAGDVNRTLSQDDLKISSATEMNLVLVNIDMMDYNTEPHRTPIFDDFLEEVASAIPASVIRFGQFPETLKMPSVAATPYEEDTYVVDRDILLEEYGLNTGDINGIGLNIMSGIQQSTGDFPNTIYFGNTLNLAPGGWGGDGSFVSFEYGDVFIHELGHALSLQHWGEGYYRAENPPADDFSYPYGGELGEESGGRGTAWNFIQADYEFVSPICEAAGEFSEVGTERSDCMQREFPCVETRPDGPGPWDGFGDYSVRAMSNFLTGSEREFGQVEDRGELIEFHLPENLGYPNVTLVNGERRFARTNYEAGNVYPEDRIKLPGSEEVEQDVYLIYGNAHATKMEANFIYEPIKYKGTLLPNIDPTDPTIFASLQSLTYEDAPYLVDQYRDITLKLTYLDGTEAYTLVPFRSFERPATGAPDEILSPTYFSVVVPGEKSLCNVELYHREFMISSADNRDNGNINDPSQNITAQNFMSGAKLMGVLDHSCNCPGTPGYIEPGTACDDGNPLTENDVEDGNCNCAGVPILPCGVINNGKFTDGLGAWWQWGSDASSEDGEAVFRDIDEIDAGIAQGPFELIENETYTVAFDAYASEDGFVGVKVFLDEEPYTDYFSQQVELSTTKQSYTLSFQYENGSADNVAMEFFMGGNNASIYLDNVCLSSACGTEEIAYNGIDDDCDPETLDDDLDEDGFVRASDCDDTDPGINPDADDVEGNAIDENCDGVLDQVLPVSYLTFAGKPLDESVLLTWEVTKEVSVSHYIIERALESDTDQYEEIGEVVADDLSAYSFEDIYPQQGDNYYRIKSVDLNGDLSYTDVINVIFDLSSSADYSDFKLGRSVVVFPNPVLDRLNISAGELIQIIDASGRQFTPTQDVSGMLPGIYFAKIKIDHKLIVRKFIKQ